MTGLREALAGYLDLRRSLGFKLERDAKLLGQFITYLEQREATHGHRDRRAGLGNAARRRQPGLAADADAPWSAASPPTWPPSTRLPRCRRPACCRAEPAAPFPTCTPHADIAALLTQAGRLKTPLRQATIKTLIGLMAVTGMRGGEVVALDDEDFDPGRGLLLVRHAKLGKHRLLPLHPTHRHGAAGLPAAA